MENIKKPYDANHSWRMLNYSSRDPSLNLAVDEAILRYVLEDQGTNTLRLWQNPPTVVVGCFQDLKSVVNIEACKELEVDILRRASGGGAAYHDYGNLNFSLIIGDLSSKVHLRDVKKSYNIFCSGMIEALKILGIEAHDQGGNIMFDGRKISGSAQYRLYDALLHHGTLMVNVDLNKLERTLGLSDQNSCLVNLSDTLPHKTPLNEIKKAIARGFENIFGEELKRGLLTARERENAKRLYNVKYNRRDWNFGNT